MNAHHTCHECECGNYRNCPFRQPRGLTKGDWTVLAIVGLLWAMAVAVLLTEVKP